MWAATIAGLFVLAAADLLVSGRRKQAARMPEALGWTLVSIALAVAFGAALALSLGHAAAGQFFAGWLTEYSLSLDNLVIFVLLIGGSTVPARLHGRVLMLGIVLALIMRGIFIALGAAALARFSWVLYLFGLFLIFTGIRMLSGRGGPDAGRAPGENLATRTASRVMPVATGYAGGRLTVRLGGRLHATPVLILIVAIGLTDLLFALDSIPAIFGLTREPYLVFTANMFALLGLRHLYVVVGGLLARLPHLSAGLAVILLFIGLKILTEALADSGVHNLGPVPVPHIGIELSLAVIAGVISTVFVAGLVGAGRRPRAAIPAEMSPPGQARNPGQRGIPEQADGPDGASPTNTPARQPGS